MRVTQAKREDGGDSPGEPEAIEAIFREYADYLRNNPALLADIGLRLDIGNMVEFGPVALSRVTAAHERESHARQRLEDMASANFTAQTQTHAAVVDMLESLDAPDLARRVDELARSRFGLTRGVIALEGPGSTPEGWLTLVEGQVDLVLGPGKRARLGHAPTALGLFGDLAPVIGSVALVRLTIREPRRQGLVGFAATDSAAFTADMGSELVIFLASVLERTAERWLIA